MNNSLPNGWITTSITLASGQVGTFSFSCPIPLQAGIGTKFTGTLWLQYSVVNQGQQGAAITQQIARVSAVVSNPLAFSFSQTNTGSSGQWHGVASSASGQYLVAVSSTGSGIWTSSNYGASWVNEGNSAPTWYAVTSSSSGQYMVAVTNAGGSGTSPGIWNSSNYGVNWAQQTSAPTGVYWTSVASNSSGQDLVAVQFSGDIWTSTNYGKTWNDQGNSGLWRSVASSSSGQYLVAVQQNGDIWASNNYGISTSWVDEGNYGSWYSVASSARLSTSLRRPAMAISTPRIITE